MTTSFLFPTVFFCTSDDGRDLNVLEESPGFDGLPFFLLVQGAQWNIHALKVFK